MAEQLQLNLFGLAGFIGMVVVDRAATINQVKDAIIDQCRLPSWQYRFLDGETELTSLESVTAFEAQPGTSLRTAKATRGSRI